MNDNSLIALLRTTITAQLASVGLDPAIPIAQAFQPTQQGVNTATTIYMYKVDDRRIGFPLIKEEWIDPVPPADGYMRHTELQQYETTFQISALAPQNPANTSLPTASDIVNAVAAIMQSAATVQVLETQTPYPLGVLRVSAIRNPYFTDDRERFEASPSFDFTITHKQVIIGTVPVITSEKFKILSV